MQHETSSLATHTAALVHVEGEERQCPSSQVNRRRRAPDDYGVAPAAMLILRDGVFHGKKYERKERVGGRAERGHTRSKLGKSRGGKTLHRDPSESGITFEWEFKIILLMC